jgi:hypothetical protein
MATLRASITLASTGTFPVVNVTGVGNFNLSDLGNIFNSIEVLPGVDEIIYDENRNVGGSNSTLYAYFELSATATSSVGISIFNKSTDPTFSAYSQIINVNPGTVAFIPINSIGLSGIRIVARFMNPEGTATLNFFLGENS